MAYLHPGIKNQLIIDCFVRSLIPELKAAQQDGGSSQFGAYGRDYDEAEDTSEDKSNTREYV